MNSTIQRMLTKVVALFFLSAAVLPAAAQPMHTLEIRGGSVYVDGEQIPPEELPPSLDIHDMDVQLRFSGSAQPVIELGGTLYTLSERRLYEVEEGSPSGGVSVFFRGAPSEQEGQVLSSFSVSGAAAATAPETEQQALRQVEQQRYMQEMRRQSQALYDRLVQEQELERATYLLAERARALGEGAQRRELVASLREKLEEIFDLKQENRRREIERLESQLEVLQERLQEREHLREEIIEHRLQELIGSGEQEQ